MMDEQNVRFADPVKHTIQRFFEAGYTYGSVIFTEWFSQSFGLKEPQSIAEADQIKMIYAQYMGALRARMLAEHNMALRTKSGYGQEVVLPDEQTRWAMADAQSAITLVLSKTRDRLTYINHNELSDTGRRENMDALNRLSFLDRYSRKALP